MNNTSRALPRSRLLTMRIIALCGIIFLLCCSGCMQRKIRRPAEVDRFITTFHAREQIEEATYFDIFTLLKGTSGPVLRVYIEGDGLAWNTRHRISPDPTPRQPLALLLAAQDPSSLILYIGRPCQYVTGVHRRNCLPQVWTSGRFCTPVIEDVNQIISAFKQKTGARQVEMVGYSGGGGVAALVASRRDDVTGILTLAGNLDHAAWTSHHGVSPLVDSLNPLDIAEELKTIPQLHVSGAEDEIVPPHLSKRFIAKISTKKCRHLVLENISHENNWLKNYHTILSRFEKLIKTDY